MCWQILPSSKVRAQLPLLVSTSWKCEPMQTSYRLEYAQNAEALAGGAQAQTVRYTALTCETVVSGDVELTEPAGLRVDARHSHGAVARGRAGGSGYDHV